MDKSATQWMIEPLKKYATFSGRARRKEYWWFQLFVMLVTMLAFAADAMINGVDALIAGATGYVQAAESLLLFLPSIAVSVRRLHDTDRRGWWLLMPLLPAMMLGGAIGAELAGVAGAAMWVYGSALLLAVAALLLLVWYCSRGTIGDNRFGPDPISE